MGGQTAVEITRAVVEMSVVNWVTTTNDLPEPIDGNENDGPLELMCSVREQRRVSRWSLRRPPDKASAADGKQDEGAQRGQYLPGGT